MNSNEKTVKLVIQGFKEKYAMKLCPKITLDELKRFLHSQNIFNYKTEDIAFYQKEARILPGFLKEYTVEEILNDQEELVIG